MPPTDPFGDAFIRLIKMVVGPIIFLTIVVGIASMGDLKKVGRVGFKAVLYFEVLTTVALLIGLLVANWLQPGAGMHVDPASLDAGAWLHAVGDQQSDQQRDGREHFEVEDGLEADAADLL